MNGILCDGCHLRDWGLPLGKGKFALLCSDNILKRVFSEHKNPQQHTKTPYLEQKLKKKLRTRANLSTVQNLIKSAKLGYSAKLD